MTGSLIKYTATFPDDLPDGAFKACPDCGGTSFHFGPEAPPAVNVECADCAAGFNIAREPFSRAFRLIHRLDHGRLTGRLAGPARTH